MIKIILLVYNQEINNQAGAELGQAKYKIG